MTLDPRRHTQWSASQVAECAAQIVAVFGSGSAERAQRWAADVASARPVRSGGWPALFWLDAVRVAGHLGFELEDLESVDPAGWALLTNTRQEAPSEMMSDLGISVNILGLEFPAGGDRSTHPSYTAGGMSDDEMDDGADEVYSEGSDYLDDVTWSEHRVAVDLHYVAGELIETRLILLGPGAADVTSTTSIALLPGPASDWILE